MTLPLDEVSKTLEDQPRRARELVDRAKTAADIEQIRVQFLGKKSALVESMSRMKDLSPTEKKDLGMKATKVRAELESLVETAKQKYELVELDAQLAAEQMDPSLPGVSFPQGVEHPVKMIFREAIGIFREAGLLECYGPEVEFEDYCFDKLNFKPGHAARDMQATFFVNSKSAEAKRNLVLRTHTSPVQVRVLLEAAQKGFSVPIRIQAPGRVYRVDDDRTHSPMFHQIEGLAVDSSASMGDLRAVLDYFFKRFFGPGTKIRFRPSYFPFTEPSAEVDVSCVFCKGRGCKVCKNGGWIEVAGAGLVHPEVFDLCGWDSSKVQGWAFGLGIERLTMLKYGVPDLRLFFENRLSFLRGRNS